MNWVASLMMRLYPGWWRRRYGTELQALVEDSGPTWRTVLDLGKEGMAMQLRDFRSPLYLVLGCALLGAGVGAAVFAAAPSPAVFASNIEVQSRSESPDTQLRAVASRAFSDDNLGRLVERFSLYRGGQNGPVVADAPHRFRSDIGLTRMPSGLRISFSYPDEDKARRVVDDLAGLFMEANVGVEAAGGGPAFERLRVTAASHKVADGHTATTLTAFGLGAGLVTGLALAALWRRRTHAR